MRLIEICVRSIVLKATAAKEEFQSSSSSQPMIISITCMYNKHARQHCGGGVDSPKSTHTHTLSLSLSNKTHNNSLLRSQFYPFAFLHSSLKLKQLAWHDVMDGWINGDEDGGAEVACAFTPDKHAPTHQLTLSHSLFVSSITLLLSHVSPLVPGLACLLGARMYAHYLLSTCCCCVLFIPLLV